MRFGCYVACLLMLMGCAEDNSPDILDVTILNNTSDIVGPYEITAVIIDDRKIEEVKLYYRTLDAYKFTAVPMEYVASDAYVGTIPGHNTGDTLVYYIRAVDDDGNEAIAPRYAPQELYSFAIVERHQK